MSFLRKTEKKEREKKYQILSYWDSRTSVMCQSIRDANYKVDVVVFLINKSKVFFFFFSSPSTNLRYTSREKRCSPFWKIQLATSFLTSCWTLRPFGLPFHCNVLSGVQNLSVGKRVMLLINTIEMSLPSNKTLFRLLDHTI